MRRKRRTSGTYDRKKIVYTWQLASLLPVNIWFTREQFSKISGIKKISTVQRLNTLVADSYLRKRNVSGYDEFIMTEGMKSAMLCRYRGAVKKQDAGSVGDFDWLMKMMAIAK